MTQQLTSSALEFLQKLDQVADVNEKHPIFLISDPEDDPNGDEMPPLSRCCFTSAPQALVSPNHPKAAIRRLYDEQKKMLDQLPYKLSAFSLPFLRGLLPGVVRLVIQLLRPWLAIFSLYKVICGFYWYQHIIMTNGTEMIFTHEFSIWPTIWLCSFCYLTYTLTQDLTFLRAVFGYESQLASGVYVNEDDTLLAPLTRNNKFFNGDKDFTYSKLATPWLYNGDLKTAIPFATFAPEQLPYIRRWCNTGDGESIAFDISFPKDENGQYYHDNTKPIFLILHGLNGDSSEAYILSYCTEMNKLGHTAVVMIARSFGGTPIVNQQIFDATRSSDLHNLIRALHVAIGNCDIAIEQLINSNNNNNNSENKNNNNCEKNNVIIINEQEEQQQHQEEEEKQQDNNDNSNNNNNNEKKGNNNNNNNQQQQQQKNKRPTLDEIFTTQHGMDVLNRNVALTKGNDIWKNSIICGGFSLGGIITACYCVKYKESTGLMAAIGFGTSGDSRMNLYNTQSRDNWQAFLTFAAKVNIILPQQHLLSPIGPAKTPINMDHVANIEYIPDFDTHFTCKLLGYQKVVDYYTNLSFSIDDKLTGLYTPLLVMNANDDPVISCDTMYEACQDISVRKKYKNLLVLNTKGGGHVGWPCGWNPFKTNWWYASTVAHEFGMHVANNAREELKKQLSSSSSNDNNKKVQ